MGHPLKHILRSSVSFSLILAICLFTTGFDPGSDKQEILSVVNIDDNVWQSFVYDAELYKQRVDTLARIRFWTTVLSTSENIMIVNQASNRRIIELVPIREWDVLSDEQKETYRQLLRCELNLDSTARIFATRGKAEFYQFRKIMPMVDRGIEKFMEYGVDPWYAQSILLIESPGYIAKSPNGAVGHFQLMPKVARKFGLKVDGGIDERRDFDRSAYAAAGLIRSICLPYTREMLCDRNSDYFETELWFRLLVLHVYHAGAYNVKNALMTIDPEVSGMELIRKLWETEAKGFKNASQNYSQVALASLIRMNDLIHEHCVIYHISEIPNSAFGYSQDEQQITERRTGE